MMYLVPGSEVGERLALTTDSPEECTRMLLPWREGNAFAPLRDTRSYVSYSQTLCPILMSPQEVEATVEHGPHPGQHYLIVILDEGHKGLLL